MALVGGLRDRLVVENVRITIEDALRSLGWFDLNNALRSMPLSVRTEPVDDREEIQPNVIAILDESLQTSSMELGSDLFEYRWNYAIDVYAEDNGTGKHLTGDLRAILEGKLPSIGRVGNVIPIFNLTVATPYEIFTVELENIASGKQKVWNKHYEKFWWTLVFDVVDHYDNEND